MRTTAAVCHEPGKPLELTELDVRGPLPGEVLIRYTHAGLCRSDLHVMHGYLPGDSWPLSGPAGRYGAMCMLGTFSQYGVVHETSVVKIDPDLPLEKAALVGCGVPTGWGASVHSADVRPGETVVIYGTGGIGLNAVQGPGSPARCT